MNVMIVNITELSESEYIVTFSHDLERDISRVRIENW